jgi:hypothetical protein
MPRHHAPGTAHFSDYAFKTIFVADGDGRAMLGVGQSPSSQARAAAVRAWTPMRRVGSTTGA